MIYFDAVMTSLNYTIFNGTREETLAFLVNIKNDPTINRLTVVPGDTLERLDVDTYVVRYASRN